MWAVRKRGIPTFLRFRSEHFWGFTELKNEACKTRGAYFEFSREARRHPCHRHRHRRRLCRRRWHSCPWLNGASLALSREAWPWRHSTSTSWRVVSRPWSWRRRWSKGALLRLAWVDARGAWRALRAACNTAAKNGRHTVQRFAQALEKQGKATAYMREKLLEKVERASLLGRMEQETEILAALSTAQRAEYVLPAKSTAVERRAKRMAGNTKGMESAQEPP